MNYRHGDVLLTQVNGFQPAYKKRDLVLAEGEVTGHAHRISNGEAELYERHGTVYLRVLSDSALLTHEEHHALEIPKGDWLVRIQREYEPEGWKNVQD